MSATSAFDVVVVGAGPAGASLAWLLARRGHSVLVAGAAHNHVRPPEVLAPPCLRALAALDLLGALDARPDLARPCMGIRRRWGGADEVHDFLVDPGGRGFTVDRALFDGLLQQRAASAAAGFLSAARLRAVSGTAGAWCLSFAQPDRQLLDARARFVVDASGRARALARRLGARARGRRVLVARIEPLERARAAMGWLDVDAHADGWSYDATAPGGRSTRVHLCRAASRARPRRAEASFTAVSSELLDVCAGPGWAAIGDAAASFDPLASQGLGQALGSALAVVPAIEDWLSSAQTARLTRYQEAVRATFRHSARGLSAVYRTGFQRIGGPFWSHMTQTD